MAEDRLPVQPFKIGRPSDYSEELTDAICFRIATGSSILAICSDPDMPSQDTVYKWKNKYPEFAEKIAQAREERNEAYADQMRAIGNRVMEEDDLQPDRARVAIDAIDKAARLMKPKTRIEMTGANGGPIETRDTSPRDLAKAVIALLGKAEEAK